MAGPVKEFEVHPYVQFMLDKYSPYTKNGSSPKGVPIIGGAFVQDVRTEPLGHWQRKDCKGAICTFSDQMVADAYIAEIDPGKSTKPQRQLYEEIITVAAGRGATSVWYDGSGQADFRMGARLDLRDSSQRLVSALQRQRHRALPLFRADQPAGRLRALPRSGIYLQHGLHVQRPLRSRRSRVLFQRRKIFHRILRRHSPFQFHSRHPQDQSRAARKARQGHAQHVHPYVRRAMLAHVSQFPVGRYKKAHRHGPGAHVFLLDSTGYTLMWNEGEKTAALRLARRDGISPPAGTWHQHYNTGAQPCKFVALHANTAVQE
jgi:hypothetical protein